MSLTPKFSKNSRLFRFIGAFFLALCSFVSSGFAQTGNIRQKEWLQVSSFRYKIRIQTPTNIQFLVRRKTNGQPFFSGSLKEERGKGIADAHLSLVLPNGEKKQVHSTKKGHFAIVVRPSWPRKGAYSFRFDGKGGFAASSVTRILDLNRVDLQMNVLFPETIPVGRSHFSVQAKLFYQLKGIKALPVTLFLAKPREKTVLLAEIKKKEWLPLMTIRSDHQGDVRFVWTGKPLQESAYLPMLIRFSGSRYFLPQEKFFQVFIRPSPQSQKWQWLWAVGAMLLFVALGFFFLRSYLILGHWKWNLMRRMETKQDGGVQEALATSCLVISDSKKGLSSFSIDGKIVSAKEHFPIVGAQITILSGNTIHDKTKLQENASPIAQSDQKGFFFFTLEEYEWADIKISHEFYQDFILKIKLPHYGSGQNMTIKMKSYRTLILALFTEAVQQLSPSYTLDTKQKTAREILRLLSPVEANRLHQLAFLFEESYYSQRMPTMDTYLLSKSLFDSFKLIHHEEQS